MRTISSLSFARAGRTLALVASLFVIAYAQASDKEVAGKPCADGKDCASGYCWPGPIAGTNFCLDRNFNCALPNSVGQHVRDIVQLDSRSYICSRTGWRPARAIGETCTEDEECPSGYCLTGPPDNKLRYCVSADRTCGAPGSPGYRPRETLSLRLGVADHFNQWRI